MKLMQWEKTSMRMTATFLLVLFTATVCPGIALIPTALAAARQDLERAQDLYDFAEFQQAVDLVTVLIDGGQLTETELRDAHILRARSSVGLGLQNQAKEDFCAVFLLDQTWKPDPVIFPQDEIDVYNSSLVGCKVAEAKPTEDEGQGKPWYMKPVVWAAGGAAVLAVVLLGGGGDDEAPASTPLASFPDPPDQTK